MKIMVNKDLDISKAVQHVLTAAQGIGFNKTKQFMIATAVSELARNIVVHSGTMGTITITEIHGKDRKGIQVIAKDNGYGISDIGMALRDNYSTAKSLGIGLPGTKRLMDDFTIESEVGKGTMVNIKKWL